MGLVDELDRLLLGEVGVGDDDLVDPVGLEDEADLVDRAERAQPVVGPRVQRDEADDLDGPWTSSASAWATASMCSPVPTRTARRW